MHFTAHMYQYILFAFIINSAVNVVTIYRVSWAIQHISCLNTQWAKTIQHDVWHLTSR